jgi:hypothetical protein
MGSNGGNVMTSELPDISRLELLPSNTWEIVGQRFRDAGFDAEHLEGIWRSAIRPYEASLQRPILIWQLRHRHAAPANAYRMFIMRDPVTEHEAVEVLGRALMDDLIEPSVVVSVFDFLLSGQVLLHQSVSDLQRASVRIPEGSLVIRRPAMDACTKDQIYLGLPPRYLFSSLELNQKEWEAFQALHRREPFERPPTDLIDKLARVGLIDG